MLLSFTPIHTKHWVVLNSRSKAAPHFYGAVRALLGTDGEVVALQLVCSDQVALYGLVQVTLAACSPSALQARPASRFQDRLPDLISLRLRKPLWVRLQQGQPSRESGRPAARSLHRQRDSSGSCGSPLLLEHFALRSWCDMRLPQRSICWQRHVFVLHVFVIHVFVLHCLYMTWMYLQGME
jgi:hypothetical protein